MKDAYEQTNLWMKSLGATDPAIAPKAAELALAYFSFRTRAAQLTQQIARAIPSLTVHDITHLDALWEIADLLVGSDYPLNPMEGFVLGGAFLLHDAALSFDAYSDGQAGLRATVEWRDAFAVEKERNPTLDDNQLFDSADFAALRTLHAKSAGNLATRGWTGPSGEIFLIDNYSLRTRYGKLIGQIASSHHWPIEDVVEHLPSQVNAASEFPASWRVDPVKIACILRCADAAHLDSRRAPDFLFGLLRRYGVSLDHWKAQNWLSRVDVDLDEPTATSLLFTSHKDFERGDSPAWWVAFDAVELVDSELRSVNTLLSARNRLDSPPFRMQRVTGAGIPHALMKHIKPSDWTPHPVKIHVSNVERLIGGLGGEKLYGKDDQLHVVLRELIQNGRDAIHARMHVDPGHIGKICVRSRVEDGRVFLVVEDNGVGMSERVLTGPLLDFGTSFWVSSLVREEFPGLKSSKFKSIGRFGIGFYSTFMIADRVHVSSKSWKDGIASTRTLQFDHGLSLRPTLSNDQLPSFSSLSTRVTIRLKHDQQKLDGILIRKGRIGEKDFTVGFPDLIRALVAGLDVQVVYQQEDQPLEVVHEPIREVDTPEKRRRWLEDISFARYPENPAGIAGAAAYASRLDYISDEDEIYGLAALSSEIDQGVTFLSMSCVGGLATTVHSRDSSRFVGFVNYQPATASRGASEIAAPHDVLRLWGERQIENLRKGNLDPLRWYSITCSMSGLDLDPIDVARVPIMRSGVAISIASIEGVAKIAEEKGIVIYKSKMLDHIETHMQYKPYQDFSVFWPMFNSSFLNIEMQDGKPKKDCSFLGCLHRIGVRRGRRLTTEVVENAASSIFGSIPAIIFRLV